jgi:hypothetical protein
MAPSRQTYYFRGQEFRDFVLFRIALSSPAWFFPMGLDFYFTDRFAHPFGSRRLSRPKEYLRGRLRRVPEWPRSSDQTNGGIHNGRRTRNKSSRQCLAAEVGDIRRFT